MNDSAIKNYAVWARRELMSEVRKRCAWWDISEGAPEDVDTVNGRILSARERGQRADLLRIVRSDGYAQLVERAAYTWFNRLLAIRFMEANDRLPSHVRMLSSAYGSFEPQCLREALDLPLGALDRGEAARLVQEGDDEALFRLVFLAQCSELSECMPAVFEPVGSAMELLLPTGLLRADGVVGRLVSDIPEDDWREGVEIVGWMYQYYVSERKDEVFAGFKKGRKAERDAIAPATQLFTPHWIVRYLTENSLGRLWMLNHPDSKLVDKMPYFIKPGEEHETGFRRISSPEEIACVDPACGSGHMLVYAFELLAAMYAEAGYSNRDAARLIVEKNLTGLEIDPRAAAMASFALTMKACELDSRFLRRGVAPRITVLERVELGAEELGLCPNVAGRAALLDAAAYLDECGSLLRPERDDLSAIEADLASLAADRSLFAGSASAKLSRLRDELEPLAGRYDVVVANPPYMGSGNLGTWMSIWVKKNYPDEKNDICTCFIERGFTFCRDDGANAMITMQSWMFLGSYEKMRNKLLRSHSISSMAHMGTRAFGAIGGEVVSTTATVFTNSASGVPGNYYRLIDLGGEEEKRIGYLKALSDSKCERHYRVNLDRFGSISGSPIAYWASDSLLRAFQSGSITKYGKAFEGIKTGDNDRFHRFWFEVSSCKTNIINGSGKAKWQRTAKAGEYRKWLGSHYIVTNFENDGAEMLSTGRASVVAAEPLRKRAITWNRIGTGNIAFRLLPAGFISNMGGLCYYPEDPSDLLWLLAFLNSSVANFELGMLNPTMSFPPGTVNSLACVAIDEEGTSRISELAEQNVDIAEQNWDASEVSWEFKRHPLV